MTDLFESTPEAEETSEADPVSTVKAKFSKEDGSVDIDALLAAKAESDRYINHLQGEQKGLRDELTKRTSLEDLIADLEHKKGSDGERVNHTPVVPKTDDIPNKAMDPAAIEAMVEKVHTKKTMEANQVKNVNEVRSELERTWGKDFAKKLEDVTTDLGFTKDEAGKMAAEKPKAFLKLVIGPSHVPSPNTAPPLSSLRVATSATPVGFKTYSHYKQMLNSPDSRVRNQYWSPTVQNEMHRLTQQHGEAFLNH